MKIRLSNIFANACLCGGLLMLGTLALIMIAGGEWSHFIAVNNPKKRMLAAAILLAAWYLTKQGPGSMTMPDRPGRIGKIILLGLGLVFAGLAGEAALRLILAGRQHDGSLERLAQMRDKDEMRMRSFHPLAAIVKISPNKKLVYELRPNLNTVFGHNSLRTNSDGIRADRDYMRPKPEGITRIVGIGDSGMFGWNVEQNGIYLSILERNLNIGRQGYEVLNLAVPGYNTFQELEMLKHKGLGYQPDIVIVGWCDNDENPPFFMLRPVSFKNRDRSFLYHLLFHRAEFKRMLNPEVLRGGEINYQFIDQAVMEYTGIAGVKRAMQELKRLSVEQGFQLLVFGAMNAKICAICDELAIDYANTRAQIPADKYPAEYGIHAMHPRADGHNALAVELESILRDKGWI